jgi:polyisoprenoid-binding protein YceI
MINVKDLKVSDLFVFQDETYEVIKFEGDDIVIKQITGQFKGENQTIDYDTLKSQLSKQKRF